MLYIGSTRYISQVFIFCAFFIFSSLICTPAFAEPSAKERKYLADREEYIKRLEASSKASEKLERDLLDSLSLSLEEITGKFKMEGFAEKGHINLETLMKNEPGYGQMDGLKFDADSKQLFVSTDALFESFVATDPRLPKSIDRIVNSSNLFSKIFDWDSSYRLVKAISLKEKPGAGHSSAFLVLNAQDIGPYPPNALINVYQKNKKLIVYLSNLKKDQIPQIPECQKLWNANSEKSNKAFSDLQKAASLDKRARQKLMQTQEEAANAYLKCFENRIKEQKFFTSLQDQAQKMSDQLAKVF